MKMFNKEKEKNIGHIVRSKKNQKKNKKKIA